MKVKSPLKLVGGKYRLADWIVSHFPPHECYCEPFCGACHVLCAKEPSRVEIINDKDGDLVNFLLVARDQPERLVKAVSSLPYSRLLYEKWKKEELPKDEFERAVRWFYLIRSCFAGRIKMGWGFSKKENSSSVYQSTCQRIQAFADRLKKVQIDCLDFRECIKRYDSPETLFYCDPPFVNKEYYYSISFTEQDHRDLAEILHRIKGKVVLSYYPHPLIKELYSDFYVKRKRTVKYSTKRIGKPKPRAIELLLANFPL